MTAPIICGIPQRAHKHYLIFNGNDHSRGVVAARPVDRQTSFEHLQAVMQTVSTYGIPLACHLDNHSIFRFVLDRWVM